MSFFGMGSMEIVVIMIIALIIFGPGKLPEVAGQAGKAVRDFRRMTRDLTSEFQESVDDVQMTMDEMRTTVTDLKRESEDLAASIPETFEEGVGRPLGRATDAVQGQPRASGTQADVPKSEAPTPVATKADPYADLVGLRDDAEEPRRTNPNR